MGTLIEDACSRPDVPYRQAKTRGEMPCSRAELHNELLSERSCETTHRATQRGYVRIAESNDALLLSGLRLLSLTRQTLCNV